MADLVSYNQKHNWANAEDNRDGNSFNLSWNSGVEGITRDPAVLALRRRQSRNLLSLLMVSQGTPMLQAGDEFGFTKLGNNNTYCHDNRLNWLDWSLLEKNRDLWAFTRSLVALRQTHSALRRPAFFQGGDDVRWSSPEGGAPDWSGRELSLGVWLSGKRRDTGGEQDGPDLWLGLHFYWEPRAFRPPTPTPGHRWAKVIDTFEDPGFFSPGVSLGTELTLEARSLVIAREIPYTET